VADLLNEQEINKNLQDLDNWESVDGKKIKKEFKFKNFKQALDYTNKIGEVAEDKQHHPEIFLTWGQVIVEITNHEAGGVTESDFGLAKAIDQIDE